MPSSTWVRRKTLALIGSVLSGAVLMASGQLHAAEGNSWSVVPYFGLSQLGDQSPQVGGSDSIADGELDVAVDSGFTAGLGIRYDYTDSRWTSEIGWEYRSNDVSFTTSDGTSLPDGNYASNVFYLNGRYALADGQAWTPWIGGGLTLVQEVDIDSEDADDERSFSDSGSVGYQLMAGVDYALTERLYLTSELRYASQSGLDLAEEGGNGEVSDIDYQPVTLGLGLGVRF